MNKILLIDADFLKYRGREEDRITKAFSDIDNLIKELCAEANVERFCLALSKGPYIKKDKHASYKDKRPVHADRTKLIESYLRYQYVTMTCTGYEADDICLSLKEAFPDIIIASQDKDVYNTIEGTHLIPLKKIDSVTYRHAWKPVTKERALAFKLKQLIMGDVSDGIYTPKGLGETTADTLISQGITPAEILNIYMFGLDKPRKIEGLGLIAGAELFLKNYYLLSPLDPFVGMSTEEKSDFIAHMTNDVVIQDDSFLGLI